MIFGDSSTFITNHITVNWFSDVYHEEVVVADVSPLPLQEACVELDRSTRPAQTRTACLLQWKTKLGNDNFDTAHFRKRVQLIRLYIFMIIFSKSYPGDKVSSS